MCKEIVLRRGLKGGEGHDTEQANARLKTPACSQPNHHPCLRFPPSDYQPKRRQIRSVSAGLEVNCENSSATPFT